MYVLKKISACLGLITFFVAGSCMDCAMPIIPGVIALFGLLLAACAVDNPAHVWR